MLCLIIIKTGQTLKLFFYPSLFILPFLSFHIYLPYLTLRHGGCQNNHHGRFSKCLNGSLITRIFPRHPPCRQFLVTLCARPQKLSKLPECTDDNSNSKRNENNLDTPCSIKHLRHRNLTYAELILFEQNSLIITIPLTPCRSQTRS